MASGGQSSGCARSYHATFGLCFLPKHTHSATMFVRTTEPRSDKSSPMNRKIMLHLADLRAKGAPYQWNTAIPPLYRDIQDLYAGLEQPHRAVAYYRLMKAHSLDWGLRDAAAYVAGASLLGCVPPAKDGIEPSCMHLAREFSKHVCTWETALGLAPKALERKYKTWCAGRVSKARRGHPPKLSNKHAMIVSVLDERFPGITRHMLAEKIVTLNHWRAQLRGFDPAAEAIAVRAHAVLMSSEETVRAIISGLAD